MVAKKEDVDSVLQKCKAGVDVRDPRGEVDDVLQECQRVILDLRKWHSIETAPVGIEVLLFCPDKYDQIAIGTCTGDGEWETWKHCDPVEPTHWMPLPEPPK